MIGVVIPVPDPVWVLSISFEILAHPIRFMFRLARGSHFSADPDVCLSHLRQRLQATIASAQLHGLFQMVRCVSQSLDDRLRGIFVGVEDSPVVFARTGGLLLASEQPHVWLDPDIAVTSTHTAIIRRNASALSDLTVFDKEAL